MYGSAQIMAITGHKSVQLLAQYQRVDTEDKMKMSKTLSESMVKQPVNNEQLALPSSATLALPSIPDKLALPSTATLALPSVPDKLALPSTATLAMPSDSFIANEENIPVGLSTGYGHVRSFRILS